MIAVMDETGHCQFASIGNVAHRARVTLDEAREAMTCLESADPDSSDPDNDGRRLERVPGGWIVLNAEKHRGLVTRAIIKDQTKERVRRWRERKSAQCNAVVTTSEAEAVPEAKSDTTLLFATRDGGGGGWVLTLEQYEEWVSLYPSVNVHEEVSAMVAWCDANPERRKLARSMPRFCVTWLNKARSGATPSGGYRGTGVKL